MSILENDAGALFGQFIHYLGYGLLIARYRMGAENDHVSRFDRHLSVGRGCHPAQCRHGLSLTSCCDEYNLFVYIIPHLLNAYEGIFRNLYISKFCGGGDGVDHTPSFHHYFFAVFTGTVDNLLYPVHIGRKSRDNNSVAAVLIKKVVEGSSHRPL